MAENILPAGSSRSRAPSNRVAASVIALSAAASVLGRQEKPMLQVPWWALRRTAATTGMRNSLGRMKKESSNPFAEKRSTTSATSGEAMRTGSIVGLECHQIIVASRSMISSRALVNAPSGSCPAAMPA